MNRSTVSAVGVWFYAVSTRRYLYLMRDDHKHPESWGLPGGKVDAGETLLDALARECREEIGSMPKYLKLLPLEKFTSADEGFVYNTFFCSVAEEFQPVLNNEHLAYAWVTSGIFPRPLHSGLWSTVNFDAVRNKIQTVEQQVQTSQ